MHDETPVLVFLLVLAVGAIVGGLVLIARRGPVDTSRYAIPVRCRAGHVFTTVWIPGVSFKAIRLGNYRFQWCPVGEHRTLVTPVRWTDLDARERWMASNHHDSGVL